MDLSKSLFSWAIFTIMSLMRIRWSLAPWLRISRWVCLGNPPYLWLVWSRVHKTDGFLWEPGKQIFEKTDPMYWSKIGFLRNRFSRFSDPWYEEVGWERVIQWKPALRKPDTLLSNTEEEVDVKMSAKPIRPTSSKTTVCEQLKYTSIFVADRVKIFWYV
jgi:hypothetical protein